MYYSTSTIDVLQTKVRNHRERFTIGLIAGRETSIDGIQNSILFISIGE